MKALLILSLLMLGAKPAKPLAARPHLEVVVMVPLGFVPRDAEIRVWVHAHDPLHELSCPSFHIACDDPQGHVSGNVSDCDPFALPEDRPLVYTSNVVRCGPYWGAGDYAVRGVVTDGRHGTGQADAAIVRVGTVRVAGPPLPPAQVAEAR